MAIQPGPGYTFTASSLGEFLNIQHPWSEWDSVTGPCPLQIYGLYYDTTDDMYYIFVSPGAVNNMAVKDPDGNLLTATPPPKIQVFADGLTESTTTNYIYIVCENSGTPDYNYPDPDVPPYISVETEEQADSDTKGYLLIGIVQGSTDVETDIDTLNTYNYKGCGSLWSERFKCGSASVSYWWSAV